MSGASTKEQQQQTKAHMLENEDEFEEFEVDEWNVAQQDLNDDELWEQEWDDDAVGGDDFSQRLKAELHRNNNNTNAMS
jgi:26 proteasome complex subunit DSS1